MMSTEQLLDDELRTQINYEWNVLQSCVDRKYIRGCYASLERLCQMYRKREKIDAKSVIQM